MNYIFDFDNYSQMIVQQPKELDFFQLVPSESNFAMRAHYCFLMVYIQITSLYHEPNIYILSMMHLPVQLSLTIRYASRFLFSVAAKPANTPKTLELNAKDFSQIDMRIGEIQQAWKHPGSDNLYCETIKILENPDTYIQVASGLRKFVKINDMKGKVVVMVNLKPRKLAEFQSQGMVVCATSQDKESTQILVPEGKVGERVFLEHLQELFPGGHTLLPILNPKKKILEKSLQDFKTDQNGFVVWKDWKLMTKNGFLKSHLHNANVY